MASMEEGCNPGQALRLKKPYLPPVCSLCFLLAVQEVSSLASAPAACLHRAEIKDFNVMSLMEVSDLHLTSVPSWSPVLDYEIVYTATSCV